VFGIVELDQALAHPVTAKAQRAQVVAFVGDDHGAEFRLPLKDHRAGGLHAQRQCQERANE